MFIDAAGDQQRFNEIRLRNSDPKHGNAITPPLPVSPLSIS
jgi:hypothetical protein